LLYEAKSKDNLLRKFVRNDNLSIYIYVVNQQMHNGKICFNIYY